MLRHILLIVTYLACNLNFLIKITIRAVCNFIKALIYMLKTLNGCLQELKNKEKIDLGNPKSGRGRLRDLYKSQFKWGFAKVVVTRAGRLQEWSKGELRLYPTSSINDDFSSFNYSGPRRRDC